jgi:hypothetical protein
MMGVPMSWAHAGAIAGAGLLAYALFRGMPRRETLLQKKRRKRREKQKRIERTRTKGLHDLQMLWAVHRRGGEEALKAYVAARKPSRRYRLAHAAPPDGSALGRVHTR